jgi:TonB-dependent starch-binding outer membrane protein SusC
LYIYKLKNSKANNADTLLALECQLVKLLGITFINIQPKVMQIIVCKRMHLLPQPGNRATKPKQCFRAKAGATKLLQQAARIMKLTALLLLGACLHVHAIGFGQKISLSEREVSIEKVFQKIEAQSNYKFLYTSQVLKDARAVTITVKDASVEAVLDMICKDQPFGYRINENTVVVKPRVSGNVVVTEEVGDPIDVRGVVTDADGRPLPGANVKIKGSNVGTTTDNNGRFVIKNVVENSVLEISFVGYEMKTFTVRGAGVVNVALGQKLSTLDETVVIAYGTTSRRFTTGNIATVKAADIERQPVQNPILALQGRVPGVQITQLSGLNGGGVTIRIQGQNSIRSGLEPLIIIDGVPYPTQLTATNLESLIQGGSPLNYIDPAEIESIDVLKDADATSIYGSRAANGAILITTKKGKTGRTKISINVQKGWGKVTRKIDMMNTEQYLEMRNEGMVNDGRKPSSNPAASSPFIYAPDLTIWDTTRYTDWQKVLIGGTARYTNISASLSGGTSIMQYRVGANFNRQTTVFPGNSASKGGSVHFSLGGGTANQKLKIQLTGSYTSNDNGLPGEDLTLRAIQTEPIAPSLYNEDGTLNWEPNAVGTSTWKNPLIYTLYKDFNNTTKTLVSNATLSYNILPGLEVRSSFGFTNLQSQLFLSSGLNMYPPEQRAFYGSSGRTASYGDRKMYNWIIEPQLSFKKTVNRNKFDFLIGGSVQQNTSEVLSITGTGFNSDIAMTNLASAVSTSINAFTSILYKYNGLFGRLNYTWNDKLILNLTGRRDGSSRFGDKNKFHNFWSTGIAWIFTEENLLKQHLPFLSFGKLRGSYGTTGNDQIDDYAYLSLYSYSTTPIPYQNSTLLNINRLPNPYLQWEETNKLTGGLDLGFFKDRILVNVSFARNRSSSQLIPLSLPNITGFNSITQNFPATIQNTSWEFMLSVVNIKRREFTWTSSVNLTIPRNKLISFLNIEETAYASGNNGVIVGMPVGIIKTFKFGGMDATSGGYYLLDKDGIATVNPNSALDKTVFVSTFSRYYGGLQNSITFKGLKLDFLFQFVRQKGSNTLYYYNGAVLPGRFSSGESNQPTTVLNRWQKFGDEVPFGRYTAANSFSLLADISDAAYTLDASFIRLKNLSLSWQLPNTWIKKAHFQNGSLYFRGQNLATITRYKGLDPENQSISSLPPLQLWTGGIQIEL